jgi:DNA-directed RNA polymerase specialized sigma24 family protein
VAALHTLSADHRAVIVLRYVLDYTPGEIARALDLPRGTVNSRLRRGLDAMERQLAASDHRPGGGAGPDYRPGGGTGPGHRSGGRT